MTPLKRRRSGGARRRSPMSLGPVLGPARSAADIERRIYLLRAYRVMIDADLERLYSVSTGNLNKAVTRNLRRFPTDFMFTLTPEEFTGAQLRRQFKAVFDAIRELMAPRSLSLRRIGFLVKNGRRSRRSS